MQACQVKGPLVQVMDTDWSQIHTIFQLALPDPFRSQHIKSEKDSEPDIRGGPNTTKSFNQQIPSRTLSITTKEKKEKTTPQTLPQHVNSSIHPPLPSLFTHQTPVLHLPNLF